MKAIQDRMPRNHCYGCGADNPDGLQIKSYWQDDECVCTYSPRPEQCAGPLQDLYGGTIASLIDCHSVGTAVVKRWRIGWPGSKSPVMARWWFARSGSAPHH